MANDYVEQPQRCRTCGRPTAGRWTPTAFADRPDLNDHCTPCRTQLLKREFDASEARAAEQRTEIAELEAKIAVAKARKRRADWFGPIWLLGLCWFVAGSGWVAAHGNQGMHTTPSGGWAAWAAAWHPIIGTLCMITLAGALVSLTPMILIAAVRWRRGRWSKALMGLLTTPATIMAYDTVTTMLARPELHAAWVLAPATIGAGVVCIPAAVTLCQR